MEQVFEECSCLKDRTASKFILHKGPVLWNSCSNIQRTNCGGGLKKGMDGFTDSMALTHKDSDATSGSGSYKTMNCWKLLSGKRSL